MHQIGGHNFLPQGSTGSHMVKAISASQQSVGMGQELQFDDLTSDGSFRVQRIGLKGSENRMQEFK